LKFNTVLDIVKVHAEYHQAECRSSWVITSTNFFCPISQW